MNLNEAKQILKKNGYLVKSVKIDFSPLDGDLELVRRHIEETKKRFQTLNDKLQEKLFSNMDGIKYIYILKDYPFDGYNIVYENDNLSICVNENWNVSINDQKFEVWNQEAAIQTILDNVK